MKTAKEDLLHEHIAIEHALNILEEISQRIENNGDIDYSDINNFLEFLKEFADRCHHGKEEDFLFPALEKAGIRKEGGPIGVMLSEHAQGRNYIRQMQTSVVENTVDNQLFIQASGNYIRLLRSHIQKENNVLFPFIDTRLSVPEQKDLYDKFENHEEQVIGKGRHEELHSLLEKLAKKYLNQEGNTPH
ncbi:MAG: hemerythrin domain-containing protein [Bacteroidales bacterium]|nr:hemerythrin domain-containing protein [Bacteroidales bacterium]MDT8402215.1 hemerythrin domain-containing protein [Bacteroidales bacterium]